MTPRRALPALLACLVLAAPVVAQPRMGGTAVLAVAADPGHLNPAITTAGPTHQIAGSLFNGLVALDESGTPEPDLARSWSVAPDGLSVSFELREGARWHDGQPFTAEDVRVSLTQVLFRHHARARAGLAPAVAAVETAQPGTVTLRLTRPHPALLRQLDAAEAPMLPAHLFAGRDPLTHPANLRPVGTGPFRFVSWRRDDTVVMERNAGYYRPGLPRLDRVVFRIIPDSNTQVNALLAGEVDVLARVSGADAPRLRGRGFTVAETRAAPGGSNCVMTLAFNLDRPRTANPALRAALARSLDRKRLLNVVAFGQGRVAEAPIASGIAFAHLPGALAELSHDPVAAMRLLDDAGFERGADGVRAAFDLALFPAFARWGEAMRQSLAPLGVALRLRQMDPAAFAQAVFAAREFDLALISYCHGTDPEIGFRRTIHSEAVGPVPFSNAAAYRSTELDRLIDAAAMSLDERVRAEAYHAVQRVLARDLPYLPLVETDFSAAWRSDLADVAPWSGNLAERAWRVR